VPKQPRETPWRGLTISGFVVEAWDAELVPFGGRFQAPARFSARVTDERYPVRLTIHIDDGQPMLHALERLPGGPPLTGALLRAIPLERLVREVAWTTVYEPQLMERAEAKRLGHPDEAAARPGEPLPVLRGLLGRAGGLQELQKLPQGRHRPRSGVAVPDSTLEQVAAIYRQALAQGIGPTKAVWAQFKPRISRSTAGRWVGEARKRGFLGSAIGTRPGEGDRHAARP